MIKVPFSNRCLMLHFSFCEMERDSLSAIELTHWCQAQCVDILSLDWLNDWIRLAL